MIVSVCDKVGQKLGVVPGVPLAILNHQYLTRVTRIVPSLQLPEN